MIVLLLFISFLVAAGSVFGMCAIIYFFSEIVDLHWRALLLGTFLLVCAGGAIKWGMEVSKEESEKEKAKPVVISTTTPPQIDTTITYSNGVVDTIYTYHIIKMK